MNIIREMMQLPSLIQSSAVEFRRVRSLAASAMLSALNIIIAQFTIIISSILTISFSFLTVAVSGFLYGPLLTGFVGGFADIITYLLLPNGPFFFGFTLNEFINGFLYGCILYRKPITLKRVIVAKLVTTFAINFFLTPLWLSMMYGKAFWVYLAARIIKNILLFPLECGMLYYILKNVDRIKKVNYKA